MIDTSDAPTAYRKSTRKTYISMGTTMIPPPSPVSEPKSPAANEPRPIRVASVRMVIGAKFGASRQVELVCRAQKVVYGLARNSPWEGMTFGGLL